MKMLTEHPYDSIENFNDLMYAKFEPNTSVRIIEENCIVWLNYQGTKWYLVTDTGRSLEDTLRINEILITINSLLPKHKWS